MIVRMEMYQVCRYPVPENLRFFVMIGLCGGYTTFYRLWTWEWQVAT